MAATQSGLRRGVVRFSLFLVERRAWQSKDLGPDGAGQSQGGADGQTEPIEKIAPRDGTPHAQVTITLWQSTKCSRLCAGGKCRCWPTARTRFTLELSGWVDPKKGNRCLRKPRNRSLPWIRY